MASFVAEHRFCSILPSVTETYPLSSHDSGLQSTGSTAVACRLSCSDQRGLLLKVKVKSESEVKLLSCVWLFATPWTVAYQALPSMGFSRQEYWSGLPFTPPGDLLDSGIKPGSPALQADALTSEPWALPGIKPVSPALEGKFFTAEPPGKAVFKSWFCLLQVLWFGIPNPHFLYEMEIILIVHKRWCCHEDRDDECVVLVFGTQVIKNISYLVLRSLPGVSE